jgi:hypothetical protein
VAAITADFDLAILQQKGDRDYIGPRLRDRDTEESLALAARAEAGMRIIERSAVTLEPPTRASLQATHDRLRDIHAQAYDWTPPEVGATEISMRRAMRSHVRRLINEWDLARLYPGARLHTEEQELRPTYTEDETLEQPTESPYPDEEDFTVDPVS